MSGSSTRNRRSPEGLDAHMRTEHLQAFFRQKRGLEVRT
jgi:quinol monooxygenase YgiN